MTHPMFDPDRSCIRLQDWPALDKAAWSAATAPFDPLEPNAGVASRWSAGTVRKTIGGYGRWLGWLERSGRLETSVAPEARASRDQVRAYLQMLREKPYAPYTIAGRLQELGDALRAMAPAEDWGWISRGAGRIHQRATSVKNLNDRMRSPDEVVQLGFDLMDAANHDRFRTAYDRAVTFRDGLALAALVHRPLRIANFASIMIGENLQRSDGGWRLSFPASEMKNARPFDCPWPDELVEPLQRYLDEHRPALQEGMKGGAAGEALWIAKGGAKMKSNVLGYRIVKRTQEEFGVAINPHSFRHMAATTIATDDPENMDGASTVLGHASPATVEKHYNRVRGLDALERYQAALRQGRKGTPRTSLC